MLRKCVILSLTFALAGLLCCCGPTVKNSIKSGQSVPSRLAFLPIKAPEGMRSERVSYLRDAARRELANAGVSLLNDEAVAKTCKSIDCPERSELVSRYRADGFFELTIDSASKNNALLGYVDQIHGVARIIDSGERELISIEHRETQTGGLLFNSGQVLEGIKSSVKNYGDNGFNLLAEKFAKTIGLKLPRVVATSAPSGAGEQKIDSVEVQTVRPNTYKICVSGTPGGSASINSGRRRYPLREASAGSYCGTHWFDTGAGSGAGLNFFAEVRSSYGDVARRDISLPPSPQCDWSEAFLLLKSHAGAEIRYVCEIGRVASGNDAGSSNQSCGAGQSCRVDRYEVYRAPRPVGPYLKVAEVRQASWTDRAASQSADTLYQLVAVGADGSRSRPIAPKQDGASK